MPDEADFPPLTADESLWLVWFDQQPEHARRPTDREIAAELVMRQWLQRTMLHRELRREDVRTRPIKARP